MVSLLLNLYLFMPGIFILFYLFTYLYIILSIYLYIYLFNILFIQYRTLDIKSIVQAINQAEKDGISWHPKYNEILAVVYIKNIVVISINFNDSFDKARISIFPTKKFLMSVKVD